MIKTIDSSVLRANFKDAMTHIKTSKKPLIIKQKGVSTAVLIDIDEFEDYLSSKDKTLIEDIKKSRKEHAKGEVFDMGDVFADIK